MRHACIAYVASVMLRLTAGPGDGVWRAQEQGGKEWCTRARVHATWCNTMAIADIDLLTAGGLHTQ
eukprot:scaffold5551_cov119-Isochrysis_galbana.AAC.3